MSVICNIESSGWLNGGHNPGHPRCSPRQKAKAILIKAAKRCSDSMTNLPLEVQVDIHSEVWGAALTY